MQNINVLVSEFFIEKLANAANERLEHDERDKITTIDSIKEIVLCSDWIDVRLNDGRQVTVKLW